MSLPAWKVISSAVSAPAPVPACAPARTASFAFGPRRVEMASATAPLLLEAMEFLYGDFAAPPGAAGAPRGDDSTLVRIERGRRNAPPRKERLLLRVGKRPVWRGRGEAEAAAALETCLAGHLLPGPDDGLAILHAACIEVPERGSVLLCAPSGGGKTTIAAALLAEGCRLVADDLCPIDPTALLPTAFPRPLAFKPGGRPPECEIEDWMVLPGEAAPLTWVAVRPRLAPGERALPLAAIVFVDHAPRCAGVLLPLGIQHAASLLAPRVAETPFGEEESFAREVTASVPALLLQYADAAPAARTLIRALS